MEGKTTASKIKDTISKIGKLQALKSHYASTMEEYDDVLQKKDSIENAMIKELNDINELEKLGVKSIFYKVLGNKNEQLEKERQEYLQVTLQHKETLNALEVIEFEKNILEKKLLVIDDLENELASLKKIREKEILATPGHLRNELRFIANKMDELDSLNVELEEARITGEKTIQSLDIVEQHMKKAKDWGNWDMMQNKNGRYSKSMKHNAIDRAMNEISRAKLYLNNFNKELRDIGYSNQRLALQVENIAKFPGMIFDNLISDWIVQTKIKNVLSTVSNLNDNVQLILKSLIRDRLNVEEEYEEVEEKRHRLLEGN